MKTKWTAIGLLVVAAAVGVAAGTPSAQQGPSLTRTEVETILDQAEKQASVEPSLLRVNSEGLKQPTRMHIMVVDTGGRVIGQRSMADAWLGSIAIAKAKAFTAMAFSSNQNALTTRSIGALSQPGGPLWNIGNSNRSEHGIIEFPGGLPIYKSGTLVGGIGVSGDGVDQDENVAKKGVIGFTPPEVIRIDKVTGGGVPYTK